MSTLLCTSVYRKRNRDVGADVGGGAVFVGYRVVVCIVDVLLGLVWSRGCTVRDVSAPVFVGGGVHRRRKSSSRATPARARRGERAARVRANAAEYLQLFDVIKKRGGPICRSTQDGSLRAWPSRKRASPGRFFRGRRRGDGRYRGVGRPVSRVAVTRPAREKDDRKVARARQFAFFTSESSILCKSRNIRTAVAPSRETSGAALGSCAVRSTRGLREPERVGRFVLVDLNESAPRCERSRYIQAKT